MFRRGVLGILLLLWGNVALCEENPFLRQWKNFQEDYAEQLEELAKWCEENDLPEQAEKARQYLQKPFDEDKVYVAILPQQMNKMALSKKKGKKSSKKGDEETPAKTIGEQKFFKLREKASLYLLNQSRKAVRAGHISLGFDFLMKALEENPDNEAARKILGYRKFRDQWLSDFEVSQIQAKKVYHEQFGWIPRAHVKRYEAGERFFRGQWISAEEDAEFHRSIENGWVIETAHYKIVTNHSIEEGVKLGENLEKLYRVWKQLFLGYYATPQQVVALFEGKPGLATPQAKHQVYFFRTRQDYNNHLRAKNPQIEMSLGLYSTGTKIAYFFGGEDYDIRTMFHEATHQLFQESRKTDLAAGRLGNFWTIEGIAVTMESLHDEGNYHVVGGFDDERMLAARLRYRGGFYVPLEMLALMDTRRFQYHPEVVALYSQSAGLTHFFIFHENGLYRDALAQILRDVYTGKNRITSIPQYTGKTYRELDEEFQTYITRHAEALKNWRFEE
ncbi:MAG: hypothetical protein Q4D62_04565 [Planctomycetia bacterium]|nr:hypothetical protein [Planctomycetia bacterium]